jgi:hypothetical protein
MCITSFHITFRWKRSLTHCPDRDRKSHLLHEQTEIRYLLLPFLDIPLKHLSTAEYNYKDADSILFVCSILMILSVALAT